MTCCELWRANKSSGPFNDGVTTNDDDSMQRDGGASGAMRGPNYRVCRHRTRIYNRSKPKLWGDPGGSANPQSLLRTQGLLCCRTLIGTAMNFLFWKGLLCSCCTFTLTEGQVVNNFRCRGTSSSFPVISEYKGVFSFMNNFPSMRRRILPFVVGICVRNHFFKFWVFFCHLFKVVLLLIFRPYDNVQSYFASCEFTLDL